jgi:hypothetical protein
LSCFGLSCCVLGFWIRADDMQQQILRIIRS